MTEAPPCPPRHQPPPLAGGQRLRCRWHAQGLRWCALLAAMAAIATNGAWARPTAAKPASVVSPSAAASATAAASAAAAAAAGSAVAAASASAARSGARFGFYGLSPVQAGQTLAQAESALGQPLTVEPAAAAKPLKPLKPVAADSAANAAAADCHHRSSTQQPGVRYTLAGALITRIETRAPRYATFSGVQVGDSLARAQQAYGRRLVSVPHPYFDQGRMLTVYSPNRRFALVMETNDSGRLITLRGGRLPEVGWLEGCS